jgi:hypothetical protein
LKIAFFNVEDSSEPEGLPFGLASARASRPKCSLAAKQVVPLLAQH